LGPLSGPLLQRRLHCDVPLWFLGLVIFQPTHVRRRARPGSHMYDRLHFSKILKCATALLISRHVSLLRYSRRLFRPSVARKPPCCSCIFPTPHVSQYVFPSSFDIVFSQHSQHKHGTSHHSLTLFMSHGVFPPSLQ
jgi:hypothetical protein